MKLLLLIYTDTTSECYCFLPGRAFFLGCRSLIVQGEKKALESMLLSVVDRCCPDFRRDALCFKPVHSSFSDFQPVLRRHRYTVVAVLISLPADMVTVLVSLHLRRLTFTGAVWIRSDSSITSVIYHLGLTQLCGVRGEACWIVHNGEPVLTEQMFLRTRRCHYGLAKRRSWTGWIDNDPWDCESTPGTLSWG